MMHPISRLRAVAHRRRPLALILATAAVLSCGAHAQSLTWDANTGTTGVQDGAGTWNTTLPNWWNGTSNVTWDSTVPDSAVFGSTAAGGTVALGQNISVDNISFITTGYNISGGSGSFTLNLSSPDSSVNTISLAGAATAVTDTISANLAGSAGLNLVNTGVTNTTATLVLSGNNSGLTGPITISGASGSTGAVILNINSLNALGSFPLITVGNGSDMVLNVPNGTFGSGMTLSLNGAGVGSQGALQGGTSMTDTWVGNIVLAISGTRVGGGVNGTLNVNGVISQQGAGFSVLFGRNTGSTTVLNAVNTYTGDTQVYGGLSSTTSTLKIGVDNAINSASDLSILGTAAAGAEVLDLNSHALTLRALDTSANQASGFQWLAITNSSTTLPSILTIGDVTTVTGGVVVSTKTFSGSINDGSGGLSLVKTNTNTQILIGNNLYKGSTTINNGILQLGSGIISASSLGLNGALASLSFVLNGGSFVIDNTGTSNNNGARIADNAVFTLNGGAFIYKGSDQTATNSSETIGAIAFGTGASTSLTGISTIAIQFGGSNTATVTAAQLTRAAGAETALVGGLDLGMDSTSSASVSRLLLTAAPTLVGTTAASSTGINTSATNTQIVPFLLGQVDPVTGLSVAQTAGVTPVPNTFVTYNPTTGLRPLSLSEFATTIISGSNTLLTSSASSSGTIAINSLIFAGTAMNLSLMNNGVLTDTSGAVLFNNSASIGGSLNFGSAEGIITVNPAFTAQISAKITGTDGVTLFGGGVLGLSGSNTFTGDMTIRGGTAVPQISSTGPGGAVTASPFGLGNIVFAGGGMRPTSTANIPITLGNNVVFEADTTFVTSPNSLTFTGGVTLLGGTRTITNSSVAPLVFSGAIGDGGQGFGMTFAGTGTTTLSGASTYSGGTTITAGEVIASGSLGNSAVTVGNSASLGTSAILGGSGSVRSITAIGSGNPSTSGATVDPGNSPNTTGILKTGGLSITDGAHISMQIGGDVAGGESSTGYDEIVASSGVTLAGSDLIGGQLKLTLLGMPSFQSSDILFLIINNGDAAVNGAFGSVTLNGAAVDPTDIVLNNQEFKLVYNADYTGPGSDGVSNDVALVAVVPEPGASTMLLGGLAVLALYQRRFRLRRTSQKQAVQKSVF